MPMVDRETRDCLAELLRCYQNGEVTGKALLSFAPNSHDTAISEIIQGYRNFLIEGGHGHPFKEFDELSMAELPDQSFLVRVLDRTVLFLQTDLEYQWRDYPIWRNPTLTPFQVIAFLITVPFMLTGLIYLEEITGSKGHPLIEFPLTILMVIILTATTLWGGARLRSLFTGIDRYVWPFYRRQQYRNARARVKD